MIIVQRSGNFTEVITSIPEPEVMQTRLLQAWANKAEDFARMKARGGRSSLYLHYRTGSYHRGINGRVFLDRAEISVVHPGATLLEYGGVVRPVKGQYLTFRLYRPSDGAIPTGRWVRTRQVRITGRRIIQSSAEEALMYVRGHLPLILQGTAHG